MLWCPPFVLVLAFFINYSFSFYHISSLHGWRSSFHRPNTGRSILNADHGNLEMDNNDVDAIFSNPNEPSNGFNDNQRLPKDSTLNFFDRHRLAGRGLSYEELNIMQPQSGFDSVGKGWDATSQHQFNSRSYDKHDNSFPNTRKIHNNYQQMRERFPRRDNRGFNINLNGNMNRNSIVDKEAVKKRNFIMIVSFLGTRYYGSQFQQILPTIEFAVMKAVFDAGYIIPQNYPCPNKLHLSRSSRTDKGVHATRLLLSMRVEIAEKELDDDELHSRTFVEKVNKFLPSDIRMFGATKVTNTANIRRDVSWREYEYLMPLHLLEGDIESASKALLGEFPENWNSSIGTKKHTIEGVAPSLAIENQDYVVETLAKSGSPGNYSDMLTKLNYLFGKFIGTHSFHNFHRIHTKDLVAKNVRVDRRANGMSKQLKEQSLQDVREFEVVVDPGQDDERGGETDDDYGVYEHEEGEEKVEVEGDEDEDKEDSEEEDDEVDKVPNEVNGSDNQTIDNPSNPQTASVLQENNNVGNILSALTNKKNKAFRESSHKLSVDSDLKTLYNNIVGSDNCGNLWGYASRVIHLRTYRTMYKCIVPEIVSINGRKYAKFIIRGSSFMLHQIRLMIGAVVAMYRGLVPELVLDSALKSSTFVPFPMVPSEGLLLADSGMSSMSEKKLKGIKTLRAQSYTISEKDRTTESEISLLRQDEFEKSEAFKAAAMYPQIDYDWTSDTNFTVSSSFRESYNVTSNRINTWLPTLKAHKMPENLIQFHNKSLEVMKQVEQNKIDRKDKRVEDLTKKVETFRQMILSGDKSPIPMNHFMPAGFLQYLAMKFPHVTPAQLETCKKVIATDVLQGLIPPKELTNYSLCKYFKTQGGLHRFSSKSYYSQLY